jgi:hypothetical protein
MTSERRSGIARPIDEMAPLDHRGVHAPEALGGSG